jgi:hypothetical protein
MIEKDSLMLCYYPTRVQNQSNTSIDNIFTDNYKFTKYTVSLIHVMGYKIMIYKQLIIVTTVLET